MSPYLYRRLMRDKLARQRQHAGALFSHTHGAHGAHGVSLLALGPVPAVRLRYAR
jgi:hypothetical protein